MDATTFVIIVSFIAAEYVTGHRKTPLPNGTVHDEADEVGKRDSHHLSTSNTDQQVFERIINASARPRDIKSVAFPSVPNKMPKIVRTTRSECEATDFRQGSHSEAQHSEKLNPASCDVIIREQPARKKPASLRAAELSRWSKNFTEKNRELDIELLEHWGWHHRNDRSRKHTRSDEDGISLRGEKVKNDCAKASEEMAAEPENRPRGESEDDESDVESGDETSDDSTEGQDGDDEATEGEDESEEEEIWVTVKRVRFL